MVTSKTIRVNYQEGIIMIPSVYLCEYSVKDLFDDVQRLGNKSIVPLPKYPGFYWHPPKMVKLRCQLESDHDWVLLTTEWENYQLSNVIPIYMVSKSTPSSVQLGVQKFNEWNKKNKVKEDEAYVSSSQPTLSQANIWADNLILSQPFLYCEPQSHEICEDKREKPTKLVVRSKNKKLIVLRSPQKHKAISKSPQKTSEIAKSPPEPQKSENKVTPKASYGPPKPKRNSKSLTHINNSTIISTTHLISSSSHISKHNKSICLDSHAATQILMKERVELNDLVDWGLESQPDIPNWDVFVDPEPVEIVAANSGIVHETMENEGIIGNDGDVDVDGGDGRDGEEESSDDSEVSDQDGFDIEASTKERMNFNCDQKVDGGAPHSLEAMSNVYRNDIIWTRASDGKVYLKKHDMFICKADVVAAVKDFSIQEGFLLKKIKHEKQRYTMRCGDPKCTWRFHASTVADKQTWMVKSHKGKHRCSKGGKHNMVGKRWLAGHMLPLYRADPGKMTVKTIVSHMWARFGLPVETWMCRRALNIMKICVNGSHTEGYSLLPQYCEQFLLNNPTSVTLINWVDQDIPKNPTFKRITICIGPAVEAFKAHCRPLIGIDACHLKGPFKGVLMTALGLDGNNGQFPLAYGVAETENDEEWCIFLSCLAKALDAETYNTQYTFMSDRHKGIISSLHKVFPQAKRRICVLHMYKNFAVNYSGAWFHDMFYSVANGYSEFVFNKGMEMINFKSPAAYKYLMSEPLAHWCRYKFAKSLKSSDNTNNFVESFNGVIVKYRGKPCLTMLESIRKVIGVRFNTRYQTALKWGEVVTPFVKKKLEQLEYDSKFVHTVDNLGRHVFETTEGSTTFIVKLGEGYCDCQKWQITGLPCKHAVRCIRILKLELVDYCDPYFKVAKYMQLYDNIINPIPDVKFWPPSDLTKLDPPFGLRKLGRPQLHHRRDGHDWEKKVKNSTGSKICKRCGLMGHNKTTCTRPRDEDGNVIKPSGQKRKKPLVNEDGTRRKRGRPSTKATTPSTTSNATITQVDN